MAFRTGYDHCEQIHCWRSRPGLLLFFAFAACRSAHVSGAGTADCAVAKAPEVATHVIAPMLVSNSGQGPEQLPLATVTVLDVGQGTAVVVRSGPQTLVYDTGGGNPTGNNIANIVLLPFLRYHGVETLQTLLVSHSDNDHSAGVVDVQKAMQVEQIIVGGYSGDYRKAAPCIAGRAWQWSPAVRFQILSPSRWQGESSNNSSCVLMLHVGDYRLLLAGDIDADRERELVAYWSGSLRSTGLLAAHHGSGTSSATAWLKQVRPDHLIYSAGYLNRFGHPHPSVVQRGQRFARAQYSTASAGALTVTIEKNGKALIVEHRVARRRYWQ